MKIGIVTVITGYNYGSTLQAFATQHWLKNYGIESEIIQLKGSVLKGRDIRIKKLYEILKRFFKNPKQFIKSIKLYITSFSKKISPQKRHMFYDFQEKHLTINYCKLNNLYKDVFHSQYDFFLSGSDQIWSSDAIYPDPFYYLDFSPSYKKIAFAPSFGKSYIPPYNINIIKHYLNDYKKLSVREECGLSIIKNEFNLEAVRLLDPTFLLNKEQWIKQLCLKNDFGFNNYIVTYFLDNVSDNVLNCINEYSIANNLNVINLTDTNIPFAKKLTAGPKDFLQLIMNSDVVYTDSFHGAVFSTIFERPFIVFERNYSNGISQSSRLFSLLSTLEIKNRFSKDEFFDSSLLKDTSDLKTANLIVDEYRMKAKNYLGI